MSFIGTIAESLKEFFIINFGSFFSDSSWSEFYQANVVDSGDLLQIIYSIAMLVLLFSLLSMLLCRHALVDRLVKHITWMAVLIWLLGTWVYIIGFYNSGETGLPVVMHSVVSSFKMFLVSNDLSAVGATLQHNAVYMFLFSLVHLMAAFVTFLFIFKMIGYKVKSSLKIILYKWFHKRGGTVHLFWGVNEASCIMAEDVRKNNADDTIIFVDIDEEKEDDAPKKATLNHIINAITITGSEVNRLETVGALVDHCYNGPFALGGSDRDDVFAALHLRNIGDIVKKSAASYFYFFSDNETQNIVSALNFQHDKSLISMGDRKPVIYIHARRDTYNEVFDHYSQYNTAEQRIKIKIVDQAYLSVTALKQDERTLPVNCVEYDKETGLVSSSFTSLIIGFGSTGQEAFKFLYEFSAFIGADNKRIPFKCYALDDKMNSIAGLFRERMPAIGEDELSLEQIQINSVAFWNKIDSIINELNYVVVTLNNDPMGLSIAVDLFKHALRNRKAGLPLLKIVVRCYDSSNENRMTAVVENLNESVAGKNNVEIILFGKETGLYSCNTIISDTVLQEAKEFNRVYENSPFSADKQWEINFGNEKIQKMTAGGISRYHAIYDINRRVAQNLSNSLHSRTKLILMGLVGKDSKQRLSLYNGYVAKREKGTTCYKDCDKNVTTLLLNMAMVEHERWIASHKLMGYTYGPDKDPMDKHVRKHHCCICPWDMLDEETQSYDCNVVDTAIKMAYKKSI